MSLWCNSGGSWDGEVASFRHDLMGVINAWEALGCKQPCPISFSSEEIQQHKEELEEYNDMVETMADIINTLGTSDEGPVSHERYSAVASRSCQRGVEKGRCHHS